MDGERQDARHESGFSLAKQIGTWLGIFLGAMALVFLAILIADKPFGLQITTLVGYTGLLFFQVFCDSRAFKGYSLRLTAVRNKIPTLLAIHTVFLLFVLAALNVALSVRSHVLSSWHVGEDSFCHAANWERRDHLHGADTDFSKNLESQR